MSILILQMQDAEKDLAAESYGVIATAAMLDQKVSVVFCGRGISQLKDSKLAEALTSAMAFGVEAVYACQVANNSTSPSSLSDTLIPEFVARLSPSELAALIRKSDSVLSF